MSRFCCHMLLFIITEFMRIVDVDGMPILPRSTSTATTTVNSQASEQEDVENRAPEFLDGKSDIREDGEKRRTKSSLWPVVGGVLGVLVVGGVAAAAVVVVNRRRSGRPSGKHSAKRTTSDNVDDQQSSSRKSFRSTGSMHTVIDEVDPAENQFALVRKLNRMKEMCQFVPPESDAWRGPPSYSLSLSIPSSDSEKEEEGVEPDDDTVIEVLSEDSTPSNQKRNTQSNDCKSLYLTFISPASSQKSSKR